MDGILKRSFFKFNASRHQQDRGILLETELGRGQGQAPRFEAEAVKIAPRGTTPLLRSSAEEAYVASLSSLCWQHVFQSGLARKYQ